MNYNKIWGGERLEFHPNVLEISVFGQGYGECILAHFGSNHWVCVDSAVAYGRREPIALDYLSYLGLSPKESLKAIIATHWHDDHTRGLSKIVEVADSASFVCSASLKSKEFLDLVSIYGGKVRTTSSGVDEFSAILNILQERRKNNKYFPQFAVEDKSLFRWTVTHGKRDLECKIFSLSPSDSAILAGQVEFGKLLPEEWESKCVVPSLHKNQTSVALWIEVGDMRMLLGADLQLSDNPYDGWKKVIHSTVVDGKAMFFKIPHHGSENAHCDEVWDKLLINDPVSVLTPFKNGSVELPKSTDFQRLTALSGNVFAAAGNARRHKKRNKIVEKAIQQTVKNIGPLNSCFGHVRYLYNGNGGWNVELYGDAYKVSA